MLSTFLQLTAASRLTSLGSAGPRAPAASWRSWCGRPARPAGADSGRPGPGCSAPPRGPAGRTPACWSHGGRQRVAGSTADKSPRQRGSPRPAWPPPPSPAPAGNSSSSAAQPTVGSVQSPRRAGSRGPLPGAPPPAAPRGGPCTPPRWRGAQPRSSAPGSTVGRGRSGSVGGGCVGAGTIH